MQTTHHLLMVCPVRFGFNEETAANNVFQQKPQTRYRAYISQKEAREEFEGFVELLRDNGVDVDVVQDTLRPPTPDSIFPNNCFSTHVDGDSRTLVIYPMFAHNRRLERTKLLEHLAPDSFSQVIDLTGYEENGMFLEGTGSLVLDRVHHVAYACVSPRTHPELVERWARLLHYDYLLFDSVDENGTPVYHTNVVMHVGTDQAVVCLDTIRDAAQRKRLTEQLHKDGKEIVEISIDQMHHFAGNMLEIRNRQGEPLLVMSATALSALTPHQRTTLERHTRIIAPDIHVIENIGGGSARCMMAELF